jgi:acyl phosphate:glycerol-3-phosphate acyltransferase
LPVQIIAAVIIGYLLGSIPFAYIIARLKLGIDIRKRGSGNAGALAVWREVGPVYGVIALAADVGKGVLAVYVGRWVGIDTIWWCLAGFATIAGHDWPVFLGFRGGKGAATIMGVLLALMPVQFAIGLGIAIAVIVPTSNIRLGMVGLAFIPLIAWLFHREAIYIYYPLFLILFLGVYTLVGLRGEVARAGEKKNLIVDKNYNFWQTKKNG